MLTTLVRYGLYPGTESRDEGVVAVQATRVRLNRERVVRAGLAYVDRHGLAELSLHKLGAELGVRAASLYNHVASKDDLLDGIVGRMWSEVEAELTESGHWRQMLGDLVHAIRRVLRAHPQAAPLLVRRSLVPIPALRAYETVLAALREAGFADDRATDVVRALGGYALGVTLSEVSWAAAADVTKETERQRIRRVGAALPADVPDNLLDVAMRICGDCDFSGPFEMGLELMLLGLEQST